MDRQTVGFAARSQKPKSKGKAGSEMEGHSMRLRMKGCQRTSTGYLSMICSLPRPVVSEAVPLGEDQREEKCGSLWLLVTWLLLF